MAAQEITKAIAEHLTKEEVHVYGRLSFWITIYYNKAELLETVLSNGVCNHEQFEGFFAVSPFFASWVDFSDPSFASPTLGFQPGLGEVLDYRRRLQQFGGLENKRWAAISAGIRLPMAFLLQQNTFRHMYGLLRQSGFSSVVSTLRTRSSLPIYLS